MKAIILAAGRGSRLQEHTENVPKCLVKLADRPLLFWQLEALSKAGLRDIAVVCGYKREMIQELANTGPAPFTCLENSRWAETNMLSSLWLAADWADGDECVISYSDIVYPQRHVESLLASPYPVSLTYDADWERLWRLRSGGDPLYDAETFHEEGGLLQEIGQKPQHLDQVRGQYMGLLKLNSQGWNLWRERCLALGAAMDKMDMTGFLRQLLANGCRIGAVPVHGAWCEVDSDSDLNAYETALAEGNFSHDWRC